MPPALDSDGDVMGEAGEAPGIELTDEDMQRRQMLEQVVSFVQESPDDAAMLFPAVDGDGGVRETDADQAGEPPTTSRSSTASRRRRCCC